MAKKEIKIYLESEDIKKLIQKAEDCGFKGRGATSRYLEKVIREPIVFLDSNTKALLNALKLQPA